MTSLRIGSFDLEKMDKAWMLIIGLVVFRLIYIGFAPVTAQEAYYWLYSQHPALSYVDHPPLVGYSILLGTTLFGDNGYGIKFMAVIWSLLTNILLYQTARRALANHPDSEAKNTAFLAVLLFNLTLFANIFAVIQQPDPALLFFWLLVLYFIQEFRITAQPRNFIFAGIALGFGLLCKYTAVAVLPGILIALLIDKELRRSLLTPYPYLAMVIAAVVFMPVIVWNWQHDWVSFMMQFNQRAKEATGGRTIHIGYFLQLIATQLAMLTPLVFVLFVKSCITMSSEWRTQRPALLHFLSGVFLIIGFTLISLTSKVKFHWLLPGYLGAIVAIALLIRNANPFRSKWFSRSAWLSIGLVAAFYVLFIVPGFQIVQVNNWSGWKTFTRQVVSLQEKLGGKGKVFIFTDSHKTAAYITLYSPEHQRAYAHDIVGSFAKQLSMWELPQSLNGMDGLYVTTEPKLSPPARKLLGRYFDEVTPAATFSYPLLAIGDDSTRRIYCFLAKNYHIKSR
jgi:4-amino-4-deoxy-L-arabinose transferase-like glycosyltransferase